MSVRKLFIIYLSALCLLLVSVMASVVITELSADDLVEDAAKINVAGRQRMLSQRIIYLAQDLSFSQEADTSRTRAELRAAIDELQAAMYLFEESHFALSTDPDIAADTYALYFTTTGEGLSLDERISTYLKHATGILENPQDAPSLAGLLAIERGGLLRDLDAVVAHIEEISVARVGFLQDLERWSLLLAIAIILIEVAFVFLPGHRMLQGTLDNLRKRNAELQEAHETSEKLRKEQAEFTYSVSHDLKSPANSIGLILSELLIEEKDRLSPDGLEMVDEALSVVQRIGLQVEDILAYAWATAGEVALEEIDVADLLTAVTRDLRPLIEAQAAKMRINADVTFNGDRRQLRMLVQNLMENALKFHAPGSTPEIEIDIRPTSTGDMMNLSIRDNGIGISKEDQERVFGLFERLHTREVYDGTGLGLATCRRVVENFGGSIKVTSEPGRGTCFHVELPGSTQTTSIDPDHWLETRKAAA